MKKLVITVFTVMFLIAPIHKAHAAVAGVMALTGAGAAGSVAIAGLASPLVGAVSFGIIGGTNGDDMSVALGQAIGLYLGGMLGLVLLDEESGSIEFKAITNEVAAKLEINKNDAQIYNSELEEANIIFAEVQSQLDAQSSVEESQQLWDEAKEFLSPETYAVMQKLAQESK